MAFSTPVPLSALSPSSPATAETTETSKPSSSSMPSKVRSSLTVETACPASSDSSVSTATTSSSSLSSSSEITNSSARDKPPVRERRVSFKPRVQVRVYPARSDKDMRAAWLQPEDFQRIRKDCRDTVTQAKHSTAAAIVAKTKDEIHDDAPLALDNDLCERGLETKGRRRNEENRFLSYRAVLIQQELHRQEGVSDPDSIARYYGACSAIARRVARRRAVQDAREVLGYSMEDGAGAGGTDSESRVLYSIEEEPSERDDYRSDGSNGSGTDSDGDGERLPAKRPSLVDEEQRSNDTMLRKPVRRVSVTRKLAKAA